MLKKTKLIATSCVGLAAIATIGVIGAGISHGDTGWTAHRGIGGSSIAQYNVQGLIDERSPGIRPEGVLYQTKHPYVTHFALPPVPGAPTDFYTSPDSLPLPIVLGDYVPNMPFQIDDYIPPQGEYFYDVPPFFIDFVPPSYGGGGVCCGTVVPPVSPVPEPSTWAMLIIGLGGLGAIFRRNNQSLIRC